MTSGTVSCCTMNFFRCRILVTGLLLINTILLLVPNDCSAFPVSQRLLDEAVVSEYGMVQKDYGTVPSHQRPLSTVPKCMNVTNKIYESNLRLRKRNKRVGRLKEALIYLRHYGYLGNKPLNTENVEQALRAFQRLAGIHESGRLTKLTWDKMRTARCGNVDIAHASRSKHKKRFAQVSKWVDKVDRSDILRLKWFIERYTNDIPVNDIRDTVKKSFQLWADQALLPSMRTLKLDFTEASFSDKSDINILWAEGDHGDAYPFDGPGNISNVLAHTFYPSYQDYGTLNGNIHFDDYENWVMDHLTSKGVYFPYVLTHEIGHALGLGHSNRQEAIMNPIYKQIPLNSLYLDVDDKCALNWNYIGPSSTCLFIWLMVEYLPKIPTLNSFNKQTPTVPSAGAPDAYRTQRIGRMTLEKKVDQLFQSLQTANIPLCSEDNAVKFQYEELIKKNLDLSRHDAHLYSDVACKFASGLSQVVEKQKRQKRNVEQKSVMFDHHHTQNNGGPLHMTVHSYSNSAQNKLDPTSSNESNPTNLESQQDFDEDFYRQVLRLLASSR